LTNLRLSKNDTVQNHIMKLSDGNIGCVSLLSELVKKYNGTDSAYLMYFHLLDEYNIYGADIWLLYNGISQKNIDTMIGLLKIVQLNFLSKTDLISAINNFTLPEEIFNLLARLKISSENFGVKLIPRTTKQHQTQLYTSNVNDTKITEIMKEVVETHKDVLRTLAKR
jgi:hypothetical protein